MIPLNDRWFGALFFVLFGWLAYTIKDKNFQTKAFPIALIVILMFLCVAMMVRRGHKEKYNFTHLLTILLYVGILVGYVLLMPYIGFILSTTAFLAAFLLLQKYPMKFWQIILFSVVTALVLWLLFAKGFNVRLPEILF